MWNLDLTNNFEASNTITIGNNYNFQSQSRTFYTPDNIPNGQFTLVFTGKRNGKTISSSKTVVVRNNKETYRTGRVLDEKICLIYPNPTNSRISLNLDKSISEFYMNIKDLSGRNVLSKSGLNNTEIKIDLSQLHRGFYFAEVFGDGNRLKTIKLIKL